MGGVECVVFSAAFITDSCVLSSLAIVSLSKKELVTLKALCRYISP